MANSGSRNRKQISRQRSIDFDHIEYPKAVFYTLDNFKQHTKHLNESSSSQNEARNDMQSTPRFYAENLLTSSIYQEEHAQCAENLFNYSKNKDDLSFENIFNSTFRSDREKKNLNQNI